MATWERQWCRSNRRKRRESRPNIGRIPALIAAVAVVGIAIGAAAGLLTLMLYQVERFALGYIENAP